MTRRKPETLKYYDLPSLSQTKNKKNRDNWGKYLKQLYKKKKSWNYSQVSLEKIKNVAQYIVYALSSFIQIKNWKMDTVECSTTVWIIQSDIWNKFTKKKNDSTIVFRNVLQLKKYVCIEKDNVIHSRLQIYQK